METIKSYYGSLTIGGNTFLQVEGTGTVLLNCSLPDASVQPVILKDVLYFPTLCHNWFSWNSVHAQGYICEARGNYGYLYTKNRKLVLTIEFHNGLPCYIEAPKSASNTFITYNTSFEQWHNALGHPSQIVPAAYQDGYIIPPALLQFECILYIRAKSTHKVPHIQKPHSSHPFKIIYSDLSSISPVPSYANTCYYMTFMHNFPRMSWVYFLKSKGEAPTAMEHFINIVEWQFSATILYFKTDNGGEYINNRMQTFWSNKGIRHEPIAPYNHESNGIPERYNRTIQNMMHVMLLNLDKCLWAESYSTAVYLRNRLPYSFLNGMTTYEGLYHVKLEMSHLRTFGASCYIHILSEKHPAGSKLHSRAELAMFVAYTSTPHIYRIQESNKHICSVLANECYLPKNSSPTTPNSLQLSDTPTNSGTESRFAEIEMDDPYIIANSNEHKNFKISVPQPLEDAQQYLPIESPTTSKPAA